MRIKWPWARKQENRVANLRAVRIHKREPMPGFMYYGDFEENKRKSEALRKKAQGDG